MINLQASWSGDIGSMPGPARIQTLLRCPAGSLDSYLKMRSQANKPHRE